MMSLNDLFSNYSLFICFSHLMILFMDASSYECILSFFFKVYFFGDVSSLAEVKFLSYYFSLSFSSNNFT